MVADSLFSTSTPSSVRTAPPSSTSPSDSLPLYPLKIKASRSSQKKCWKKTKN